MTIVLTTIGLFAYSKLHTPTGMGFDQLADFLGAAMIAILISLALSIFLVRNRNEKILAYMSIVSGGAVLLLYMMARIFFPMEGQKEDNVSPIPKTTAPAQNIKLEKAAELPFFYGLLPFQDGTIYMYTDGGDTPRIQDSLVIYQGNITYAPPYFYPYEMKIDYQLVRMVGKSKTRHYIQLIVNKENSQTAWFSKEQMTIEAPEDYVLNAASLDPIYPDDYPIRERPMNHASPKSIKTPVEYYVPISIYKDYVEVRLLKSESEVIENGYMLWRKDDQLLVRINPFW